MLMNTFDDSSATGQIVLVQGVEGGFISAPLHRVNLSVRNLAGKPNQKVSPMPLKPISAFEEPFNRRTIDCVGPTALESPHFTVTQARPHCTVAQALETPLHCGTGTGETPLRHRHWKDPHCTVAQALERPHCTVTQALERPTALWHRQWRVPIALWHSTCETTLHFGKGTGDHTALWQPHCTVAQALWHNHWKDPHCTVTHALERPHCTVALALARPALQHRHWGVRTALWPQHKRNHHCTVAQALERP